MLATPTIQETANDHPGLYSFRITGEVTRDDMTAMADYVNDLFDRYDKIDMMLTFDGYTGSKMGAGLSWENITSRIKAISNVRNYLVVAAPDSADTMISVMDKLIPVNARTFDSESEALAYLAGEPPVG